MGYGSYSSMSRNVRATNQGYYAKSYDSIASKKLSEAMSPNFQMMREARDSDEHPISVPIIIGLDVTASMGSVPANLIKDGLPTMVDTIIEQGVPHPQVMFMGIGDHKCDRAPLQVGQFESSDELLDKWLIDLYPERGGGGNGGRFNVYFN